MKTIQLSQGKEAVVCDCHYDLINDKKWHYRADAIGGYAQHSQGYRDSVGVRRTRTSQLHRLIIGAVKGQIVDHINRNKLDNRCSNLRIVTFQENINNRDIQRNNTSGFTGVQYRKARSKWIAIIGHNKHYRKLGSFDTPEEAHRAYLTAKEVINAR